MKEWSVNIYKNQKKILEMQLNKTLNIHEQLLSLRAILPYINVHPSSWISQEPESKQQMNLSMKYEHKTNIHHSPKVDIQPPQCLGFLQHVIGAFGTFMGIFNKAKIKKLQI